MAYFAIPVNKSTELLIEALDGLDHRPVATLRQDGRDHTRTYKFDEPIFLEAKLRWIMAMPVDLDQYEILYKDLWEQHPRSTGGGPL